MLVDIGNFGKTGLLKALQTQGLSIGVNWYRVEPMDKDKKWMEQTKWEYLIPEKIKLCDGVCRAPR